MDSPICRTALDTVKTKESAAQHYGIDLHRMINGDNLRNQTPLLNWGYATRIQCVQSRLHQFVSMATSEVQVVILGPGLDRTGFKLVSEFQKVTSLVEVDLQPICELKRHELLREDNDFPLEVFPCDTIESSFVVQGKYKQAEYSLIALDLNLEGRTVKSTFDRHLSDSGSPILVVSELVMSYLTPVSSDSLLGYFGDRSSCSILLYEALGAELNPPISSVTNNYRQFYQNQFQAKLIRGRSTMTDGGNDDGSVLFHPLGMSLGHVQNRLQTAGFEQSHASHPLPPPCAQHEDFDEHAAMALHIQTYVVACGVHCTAASRWQRYALQGHQVVTIRATAALYRIASVVVNAEDLRQAFAATYDPPPAPPVRKMLQSVLRTDLAGDDIGSYYQARGGNYWTAYFCGDDDDDDDQCVTVGGLGVRLQSSAEAWSLDVPCFEIQRVFVQDDHRGQGIASTLLKCAVEAIAKQQDRWNFVAVTLTILEDANRFYQAKGFREVGRRDEGELTYVTYVKNYCFLDLLGSFELEGVTR